MAVDPGLPPSYLCPWFLEPSETKDTLALPSDPELPNVEFCGWSYQGRPYLCECDD